MNKTRDVTLLILLVLGITFLLSLTFSHCEVSDSRDTLTGKVEWMATDENNQITLVAIGTQAGDYLVGDDTKGRELLQLVNKTVKARGKVVENENGQKTIFVSKYELVPQ